MRKTSLPGAPSDRFREVYGMLHTFRYRLFVTSPNIFVEDPGKDPFVDPSSEDLFSKTFQP